MREGKAGFLSIALESAARGILIPILSLVFLSRSFSLAQLPAGTAACSIAILLFELPGGILSDRIGRKKMFLSAQCLYLLSLSCLMFGKNMQAALFAMILYGTARAFSSGSMDALLIDGYLLSDGTDSLPKITARLSVVRGGGLALGALAGGGIYQMGTAEQIGAEAAIFAAMLLTAASGITAFFFTREICSSSHTTEIAASAAAWKFGFGKGFRSLFFTIFMVGGFISLIEIYWQPYFSELLRNDSLMWLLGVLSFGYFGVAILGSIAGERVLKRRSPGRAFPEAYLLSGICLLLLGIANYPAAFFIIYLLLYFLIGIGDMAFMVSLNEKISPSLRATVLSCQSFLFQMGGLMGAVISGLGVTSLTIPGLWLTGGILFIINMGIVWAVQAK